MELILETRDQANGTVTVAGGAIAMSPPTGEDYWSYRVRLTEAQAVLGFPKYSTIGIGFAVEDDWNTNLSYSSPTDLILNHILDNKGDDTIDDADVREAILMIQRAVLYRCDAERLDLMKRARDTSPNEPVDYELFDELASTVHTMRREQVMLLAEVDRLRAGVLPSEPVAADAFPGASPIPDGMRGFVTLLARLGVPTKDGRVLLADGKFELPQDAPIYSLVDETIRHSPTEAVGRILGLWPVEDEIYAVGVAGPELAEDLNEGRLVLGMDLDAEIAEPAAQGDPPLMTINSGRVRGAKVNRPEAFAWAS